MKRVCWQQWTKETDNGQMERRTLKIRGRYWGGEGTNWTDTAGYDKITGRQVVQILSQEKAPCLQRRKKRGVGIWGKGISNFIIYNERKGDTFLDFDNHQWTVKVIDQGKRNWVEANNSREFHQAVAFISVCMSAYTCVLKLTLFTDIFKTVCVCTRCYPKYWKLKQISLLRHLFLLISQP